MRFREYREWKNLTYQFRANELLKRTAYRQSNPLSSSSEPSIYHTVCKRTSRPRKLPCTHTANNLPQSQLGSFQSAFRSIMRCSVAWVAAAVLLLALVGAAARTLVFVWIRPRKLEWLLRKQGMDGTRYRFPFGDLKESSLRNKEAKSKPMPLSHDVAHRIVPFYWQAAKEYGKTFLTWVGPVPRIMVTDPELIKEIIANKLNQFEKPESRAPGTYVISGLVTHNGEKWAKHRRIVNPAFLLEKLKSMMPGFSTSCETLIGKWEKMVDTQESVELDVWHEFQSLTQDVISRTAFGSSYEEGKRIFELQDEQARLLLQAFVNYQIPGYRFLPTKSNRRAKEIHREVRRLLRCNIEKRLKAIKSGIHSEDLLGFLLDSSFTEMRGSGKHQEMSLTIDDVIDECKLFYFDGQETTSIMLTWTLVALSMKPIWQERAREEVLQVFGRRHPDFDGLSQLKIVSMIFHEVLILYPPAWILSRTTLKETKLGKFTLPAGINVSIAVLFAHHNPEYWGEDVHEFNPERFAEGISRASKCQNVYLPFGGGPRICVGQNFALLEGKLALAMILQRFSFELSPSYAHAPHTILTIQPQHGAQIILRKL